MHISQDEERRMTKNSIKSLIPALLALLIVSCGQKHNAQAGDTPHVSTVSVKDLHDIIESGRDIYLLDVRTDREFEINRLRAVDNLIPYDKIKSYEDQLPKNKNTEIYTFCRTGRRSGIAATTLADMGYTNVHNVAGGITAWLRAGYRTVNGPSPMEK
jgi:rhodanese-related sulfurtransferase